MKNELSIDEINEIEERRIERMQKEGIDENEVLDRVSTDVNTWNSYFNENITRGKDDANFVYRDQWTAIERSEFTRLFKPAMTFNKLQDAINKTAGEERENRPDLIVRSLTGKAEQKDIDLRSDLVRTISYQSQSDLVYQQAYINSLSMGFGAFQTCIDYESPFSFNQIIRDEIILDVTRTAFDPTAIKPHKGDGNFCSRDYIYTRQQFNATYPYILDPVSFIDPYILLDFQWLTRNTIIIRDYYSKEWFPLIIYKLSNGMIVTKEEWESKYFQEKLKIQKEIAKESNLVGSIINSEIPKIISERQTQDYKIMHYRCIKDRIIDFKEWPSKYLPIIFVDGNSFYIEGRQHTKSFIREVRDAQKAFNYFNSELVSDIKNRRREQWMATPDNIVGYEQQWRNPELQMGALMAKPDPKNGQMPVKMPAWDVSQGLLSSIQAAFFNIQSLLGYSDNQEQANRDISGKARKERKIESALATYLYRDNLNQAIEQSGRIKLDLLPYVYGEDERHVVLSKKGNITQSIILNKKMSDGSISNQIIKGDFDIEIDTGPSFAVQKEIALEFLSQTLQAYPQAFPLIADLWAKNLDVQFMPQIAERFKTMVPPEILAKEEGNPPPPPQPPSPEQQLIQMEAQLKQQQLVERAQELKIRQEEHEIEKAKMMLDAKKIQTEMQHKMGQQHLDSAKTQLDFASKITKILSDHEKKN